MICTRIYNLDEYLSLPRIYHPELNEMSDQDLVDEMDASRNKVNECILARDWDTCDKTTGQNKCDGLFLKKLKKEIYGK